MCSVLPSLAEGISNTILEAMATGLPIIATRVGGNPELVEEGRTALLVPADDPQAMAAAIAVYADDAAKRARAWSSEGVPPPRPGSAWAPWSRPTWTFTIDS